jgi:DNA primase small subunit
MKSMAFVQDMFREYYVRDLTLGESVRIPEAREYGFASFEGWMLRHKSFTNSNELTSFLRDCVPRDAYFSCAYYEEPEAEMEKKGWLGADLVFDIDADHIPTLCDKIHDEWTCGKCGFAGKGIVPQNCPVCGSEKFTDSTWPCEVCLASAKSETVKLLDVLMKDFGFSEREMHVFFSGHRGYHVHVEADAVKSLDAIARKEIVDYVLGLGFDAAFYELNSKGLGSSDLKHSGWRGRVSKGFSDFILEARPEDLKNIGLKRNVVETLIMNKNAIAQSWNTSNPYTAKGIGPETWRKIVEYSVKSQSANVDTVVTTDIHRLIRMAGTLHGKTGLKKIEFPVSTIDDFDPFKSAVAFREGTVTVLVSNAPQFRLGDKTYGPYKKQRIELPTAVAILLLCRKRAEIED